MCVYGEDGAMNVDGDTTDAMKWIRRFEVTCCEFSAFGEEEQIPSSTMEMLLESMRCFTHWFRLVVARVPSLFLVITPRISTRPLSSLAGSCTSCHSVHDGGLETRFSLYEVPLFALLSWLARRTDGYSRGVYSILSALGSYLAKLSYVYLHSTLWDS